MCDCMTWRPDDANEFESLFTAGDVSFVSVPSSVLYCETA